MSDPIHDRLMYIIDWSVVVILATLVLCVGTRMLHVSGTFCYRFMYGILDFFAKIYQAAFGIAICFFLILALYLYFSTHEQQKYAHETLQKVSPTTSEIAQNVVNHDTVKMAVAHLKNLANQFIAPPLPSPPPSPPA